MQNYKEELEKQIQEIDALITQIDKNTLKVKNLSKCGIAISKSNGKDQYYWVDKLTQKRKYARIEEMGKLKKVAQRDYEMLLKKKLGIIRNDIWGFLKLYDIKALENVYIGMADARKKLVTPIIEPLELYVENWKKEIYEPLGFNEGVTEFFSNDGIRVRSKSELIIANMLEQKGIPYRYEYPLILKGIGTVRPDFTCLNIRTRKEYIWEHFGMMDNISYANKNIAKIESYELSGYFPGKNMIMTFETSQHAISSNIIKAMIEEYLV
ncbi:hypothetical protein [Butyrivibrio sp. MC2013]|uniref:hypothetical protein n=1 Tax=Butyrivibrio sp. MC2013 TaxID=1280686 RepID=UPI0003F86CC3|nr:hypothetical protein [Butyrivibrio sp. MC2013]